MPTVLFFFFFIHIVKILFTSYFFASLIGVTFKLPKIIRSMANDELLFRFLARKYFKREIPIPAILFGGLLTILAGGFFTFHILVSLTVFTALFISLIIAFDVILLRYRIQIYLFFFLLWIKLICFPLSFQVRKKRQLGYSKGWQEKKKCWKFWN